MENFNSFLAQWTIQNYHQIIRRNYLQQLRTRPHALLIDVEGKGLTEFNDMLSRNDTSELHEFASMLTSESDYFFEIINHREGSRRVRKLLGKSQETDEIFLNAIALRFIDIITGKYSHLVVLQAINVFDDAKRYVLINRTLLNTLYLASDEIGCIALNEIITGSNEFFTGEFLKEIAENADWLSFDDSGNFVVQHVLKFRDLECTNRIAFKLYGYYVELASQRGGSYIVEQILESGSMMGLDLVVSEFLECGDATLLRLAQSQFGNYVVQKALRVAWRERRVNLFWGLVEKLLPFVDLLRWSQGRNIAAIIDSVIVCMIRSDA